MHSLLLVLSIVFSISSPVLGFAALNCEGIVLGYTPLPPLALAVIEVQVSKELESVFSGLPTARNIFRDTIYGSRRDGVDSLMLTLLEAIPAADRAKIVKQCLFEAMKSDRYSGRVVFTQALIQSVVRLGYYETLLSLPRYNYYDFIHILEQIHLMTEDNVVVIGNSNVGGATHRSAKTGKETHFNFNGRKDFVERVDAPPFKSEYDYFTQAVSQETLSLLRLYGRKTGVTTDSPMFAAKANEGKFNDDIILKASTALWENAKASGVKPEFSEKHYAVSELEAILTVYSIHSGGMDSGAPGSYKRPLFRGTGPAFIMEWSKSGKLVYARKTKEQFAAFEKEQAEKWAQTNIGFKPLQSITPNARLNDFPAKVKKLSTEQLQALDTILNPGYASIGGFKQPHELVGELIERDLKAVKDRGYTPKRLAEWLNEIVKNSAAGKSTVKINGREYEIMATQYMGIQSSPFGDNVAWAHDFLVLDLKTGKRIQFTGGHPYMIGYYGFFEGDVAYRLPPAELIDFIEGK